MSERPFDQSPVMPVRYEQDHVFNFRCYPGIECFNACCRSIDITLTPYDVLRLQKRVGWSSLEFLNAYTVPFEMDQDGLPGVKLRTDEEGACLFMTDEGCAVYEDRPTACRYYPVGLMTFRHADEYTDQDKYALVQESHCKGHCEERPISIADYRKEQGVDVYDEMSHGWRLLVLKKKSLGPAVGKPSKRSLKLFFLASYNLDGFRDFVSTPEFQGGFDLEPAYWERLTTDDVELLQFGSRLLRQVLFGEKSIPIREGALDERLEKKRQALATQGDDDEVVDAAFDDEGGCADGSCSV